MWSRTENQVTLVFIRHGATEGNKEHRYIGRTDESLSEEGRGSLETKRALGKYPVVDTLWCSPMKRCVETANILYPHMQPKCIDAWKEMDFGTFEGKNYEELKEDICYQEWVDSNGTIPFPKGESREDFIHRCVEGMEQMLEELHSARNIGMVVHGGTIMALLSSLYSGEYFDYQVDNDEGYVCTLIMSDEEYRLVDVRPL